MFADAVPSTVFRSEGSLGGGLGEGFAHSWDIVDGTGVAAFASEGRSGLWETVGGGVMAATRAGKK